MAEFLVPKIIDQLSDVALKQLGERVNLVKGVEEEVRNLFSKLATIEKVVHDAERRRLKEKDVGVWLEKLEDITYEMDDVLDEWHIKIYKPKNLDKGAQIVRRMPTLLEKEINGKVELTLKEANEFHFVSSHGHFDSNEFRRPMTTSVFDEADAHGRESDKDSLLKHLLSESNSSTSKEGGGVGIKVLSLVGVGGSGKTTVAQIIYNDSTVKQEFKLRKWVCVSDPFDVKRIANALLESDEESYPNMSELESLFRRIKTTFSGKKFLLVLDDVWTEDNSQWKPFRDSLKDGAPGSIILVTTRSERVARAIGTDYKHSLGLMSTLDCWLILKRIALSGRSDLCERVEKIGWKIAEKCKGLPLAAKSMGSLLQFKDTVQEWQKILDSKIWEMEEAAVYLFPHFYLSYHELSPQLKHCFSYCAVFPKDTRINVEQLIRLWMAQGYLGTSRRGDQERMEMKGIEYFKNLAMRSFFQELRNDVYDETKIVSCKMHDIVHDFAQFLTKNECRIIDKFDCEREDGESSSAVRARHVKLRLDSTTEISSVFHDSGRVRSAFIVPQERCFFSKPYGKVILQDMFSCLKCVRSLILWNCELEELPREVGNLIHLRYLDLSGNMLKQLPETVCDLYYLETLDINSCIELSCLPERIGDLVHLRHLINFGASINQMPKGFEKLTSLRTLTMFHAGGSYNDIAKLKYLNQLEEILIIVHGKVDFGNAELGDKVYIQNLVLHFGNAEIGRQKEIVGSIDAMEPPPNLQKLVFWHYPGVHLPKWIVCESFINNLRSLTIIAAFNILSLPALGKLLSLEVLTLFKIPNLKHLGCEFFGVLPQTMNVTKEENLDHYQAQGRSDVEVVAFPNLKKLHFQNLDSWETWEDLSEDDEKNSAISVMPRLEELIINDCQNLDALPHCILRKTSSLKLLTISRSSKLVERYSDKTEDDWKKVSHIPQVQIFNRQISDAP